LQHVVLFRPLRLVERPAGPGLRSIA